MARSRLVAQVAESVARIHAIEPDEVGGLADVDELENWAGVLHVVGDPHPALEIAHRWLVDHRPKAARHTLVHGDLRLGNVLVDETGLRAVLDWELAHAGDPLEDLGWMCVRAWRFGSPLPAFGLGTYEELIEAYESTSGVSVPLESLYWWETFGTWRWGVMCAMMAERSRATGRLAVEPAAIGRRSCENEWDVLACLRRAGLLPADDLGAPAEVPESGTVFDLHDSPPLVELVESVHRFLDDEARAALDGSVAFHARVASNVLATIERELRSRASDEKEHRRLLELLGVADVGDLAAEIRSGARDYADPMTLAVVTWQVTAKMAVAHPGYEVDRDSPFA